MSGIGGLMKSIAYALLIIFAAISIFGSTMNYREFQRPEHSLKHFIRFVAAKTAITYSLNIMTTIFTICGGIVDNMSYLLGSAGSMTLHQSIIADINGVGFWNSIPLMLVTFIGSLVVTLLSFLISLTVYGRFFKLYMYTAMAPIPLSTFAGETTSQHGKSFIKSYIGVCLEGAIIILACIIFNAMASTPPLAGGGVVGRVWSYLGETIFNMLLLVGLIKGSDRIVKEMFGV